MSGYIFRAFWPVLEHPSHEPRTEEDLLRLAAADFRNVANRHRATITGPTTGYITAGRTVPGSNQAHQIVVLEAPAEPLTRPYHHQKGA